MQQRKHLLGLVLIALGFSPGLETGSASDLELSLAAALKTLPQSLDWQAGQSSLQSTAQALESARLGAGLRVNVGADYSSSTQVVASSSNAAAKDSSAANLSASASLAILPWSSNFDAVRSAERGFERAKLDWRDAKNTLALNVIGQYFTAQTSSRDLGLAKSNLQILEAQSRIAEQQQLNGQITREAMLGTQRNVENARLNVQQAQNTLELNVLALSTSLNTNLEGANLSTVATELELPKSTIESLIAQGLERRSDVLKAVSRVKDAEDALANAQRDRWLPDARLNLGLAQQGGYSISSGLNFQSGSLSLSGGLPVYQNPASTATGATNLGFSLSANVPVINPAADAKTASAQQSLESARASLEGSKRAAGLDVRQKFSDANIGAARVKLAKVGVQNALATLEAAQRKLEAGLSTALDLAQAKQGLAQAERDAQQAIINQHLSVLRLEQAVGALNLLEGIE